MERLSSKDMPENVGRFSYDRDNIGIGIVHLGLGAFHKGHQAVYTDDVLEKFGGDWGICGVSLRRPNARDELMPQDGLYSIAVRSTDAAMRRIIGAVKEVLVASETPDLVIERLSADSTKIITLTITEKGYGVDPVTKRLDKARPDIAEDLKNLDTPQTAIGYLVSALRAKRESGGAPVTIISCDNMPDNGAVLKRAVLDFAAEIENDLAAWIDGHIAFPSTMVDRIVPATTDDDIAINAQVTGVEDRGFTKTEPFCQWVIEDHFVNDRPEWDQVGALLVKDVSPYEHAKLRLLNGPHSAIAYMGVLFGKTYVHDVMADPVMERFVTYLMEEEIVPTVTEPKGMPLGSYMADLRARFKNEALEHKTQQISNDGSQKLPQRILAPLLDRMDKGLDSPGLCLVLAIWMECVARSVDQGDVLKLDDPLHHLYAAALGQGEKTGAELAATLLGIEDIFPKALAQNTALYTQISKCIETLRTGGFDGVSKELPH